MAESDKKLSYLSIFSGVLILVIVFLYRNYKKQMSILTDNYVEIDGHVLRQFFSNSMCSEVNLKKLDNVVFDSFRGYNRLILESEGNTTILLNMTGTDEIKEQIQLYSKKQIQTKQINYKPIYVQTIITMLPTIVGLILYLFVPAANVHLKLLYLIANTNLIFLAYNISDKRVEGGFPFHLSRRMMIVLTILLGFQIYLYFFKDIS